ncbi:hypothetical protein U3516DRAFT_752128 [Neocallimastix sp. 'constans']
MNNFHDFDSSIVTGEIGTISLNVETSFFQMIEAEVLKTLIIRFAILMIGPIVKMVINSCFNEIYLYTSIAPILFLTITNRK